MKSMDHSRPTKAWRARARWVAAAILIVALTMLVSPSGFTQEYDRLHPLGDIPLDPETYQRYLQVYPESMVEALPSAYDARVDGIVTPAKNQGSCGSCWAFASVGAVESHLLKEYGVGPTDLSEQQQVSCNYLMWGCSGGSSSALRYWETKGPLYEACFPYTANDGTPCAEGSCEQLPYRIANYHTVSTATDQFKASLYNDGPSYWRYDVYSDFDTYWSYGSPGQVYVSQAGATFRGGHAVLLIGWDDAKGAFLCKNSWGTTGGPMGDGTFWIAYTGHYYNLGFGMANFDVTALVACYDDAGCDDGHACTADVCANPGEPGAYCQNTWFPCGASDGCCGPGCTWPGDPDCACGNGVCDPGEDCDTCPGDCISGSGGGTCSACFKGTCDGICHPVKEGPDCADCAPTYCCGDGVCEGAEDSFNCAVDCGPPPVCGNGTCDPGEGACTCAEDCGAPPSSEAGLCSNGIDDDCDGWVDCADGDCTLDPACTCTPKGQPCSQNDECCSGLCRGNKCK